MNLELQTERLVLRPLVLDDIDLCIELYSDPLVVKYIEDPRTPDEIKINMLDYVKRSGDGFIGFWCVFDKISNDKLGKVLLLPLPIELDDTDWDMVESPIIPDCDIEIGYIMKQSSWGKGYTTEAAKRLVQFIFDETSLNEIVAVIDDKNEMSRNVLNKIGLREVGKRRAYTVDGLPDFRITRDQWLNVQPVKT
jgi:RimJ/RimL family protein N-acetyltransferase